MNNVYEEASDREAFNILVNQHIKDNRPLDVHKRDRQLALETALIAAILSPAIKTDDRSVHKAQSFEKRNNEGFLNKSRKYLGLTKLHGDTLAEKKANVLAQARQYCPDIEIAVMDDEDIEYWLPQGSSCHFEWIQKEDE